MCITPAHPPSISLLSVCRSLFTVHYQTLVNKALRDRSVDMATVC